MKKFFNTYIYLKFHGGVGKVFSCRKERCQKQATLLLFESPFRLCIAWKPVVSVPYFN